MINQPAALHPVVATITILGSGRLGPTIAALLGLTGTVIGARALARSKHRNSTDTLGPAADNRRDIIPVLLLGSISLILGILFLATADAGPGTGNGVVGSAAAIVLGPIAIILSRFTATVASES